VHHRALGRLGRARVVSAFVQGDPAPSVLFTATDLWPRQSTAHAFASSPPYPARNGTPSLAFVGSGPCRPLRADRITGPRTRVKKGVLPACHMRAYVQYRFRVSSRTCAIPVDGQV